MFFRRDRVDGGGPIIGQVAVRAPVESHGAGRGIRGTLQA